MTSSNPFSTPAATAAAPTPSPSGEAVPGVGTSAADTAVAATAAQRRTQRRGGWDSGHARGLGEDDVVTGDAVVVELPIARLASRCGSALIDRLIYLVVFLVMVGVFTPVLGTMDKAAQAGLVLLLMVIFFVGMPTIWETLSRGRTPGKMALGLRTVRTDAGAVTLRHCFTRHLVGVVELQMISPLPALACAFFSARSRRLGDLAAGTLVVRDRLPLPPAYQCTMPPHLQHWAAMADIAMVPDDLAVNARTVLVRAPSMAPDAVATWTRTFAHELRQVTSPPPPAGTSDVDLIRAVLAERQERELRTLNAQEATRKHLLPWREEPS